MSACTHFHALTYVYLCTISTGSQLTLCQESCHVAHVVTDRCQSQFTSIKGNRSSAFLDYLYNFNCSSPESYLIPGVPPDTEKCLQADDFCELIIFLCALQFNACQFTPVVDINGIPL